jgi:hypothetical protein
MLLGIKRWFARPQDVSFGASQLWAEVAAWARGNGCSFRGVPGEGFVIDGRSAGTAWRLEWGPSQRPYIDDHELRLRADLQLPGDLQMVLMNRGLQETMERVIFEQYVEGVQTRIDQQTPPEMRWLVMFPRLSGDEMGVLRASFMAVASAKSWMLPWLQGPLTRALQAAPLDASTPVALMVGRSRLMLRTALADPDLASIQSWLGLFQTAIAEAERVTRNPPNGEAAPTAGAASSD